MRKWPSETLQNLFFWTSSKDRVISIIWCSTWKIFTNLYFSRICTDIVKIIFEFESRRGQEGCGWTYHTFLRSQFNLSILWFFVTKIPTYMSLVKGRIFISVSFTRRGTSWVFLNYKVSLKNQWLKKNWNVFFIANIYEQNIFTIYFHVRFSRAPFEMRSNTALIQ